MSNATNLTPQPDALADAQIARACRAALELSSVVPLDRIQVSVRKGWATLTGRVDWEYQRVEAQNAVQYLSGVLGVTNLIEVKPRVSAHELRARIETAFKHIADQEAERIKVELEDGKVILRGRVDSPLEKAEAERIARAASGVRDVENLLTALEP
jgi:osmotically-inducible protein OsmY